MKRRTFLAAVAAITAQPTAFVFGRDRLREAQLKALHEAVNRICAPPIIVDDSLNYGFIRNVRIYSAALPDDILRELTR